MIRLIDILNEIKVISKITPEMIINMWNDVCIKYNSKQYLVDFESKWKNKYLNRRDISLLNGNGEEILKNLSSNRLNNMYADLLNFTQKYPLNEIKIIKPTTPLIIGNKKINPSTSIPGEQPNQIQTHSWEDGKNLLSSTTKKNTERLFIEILGITPKWVKIEISPKTMDKINRRDPNDNRTFPPRKSFYIYGEYNEEPILIARRETSSHSAGQTKLYSKYKVFQLSKILYNKGNKWEPKQRDKEYILKALKINV